MDSTSRSETTTDAAILADLETLGELPRYERTEDVTRHEDDHVVGHEHDVNSTREDKSSFNGTYDDRHDRFERAVNDLASNVTTGILAEREARENERANRRNFNRMLTLVLTVVLGIAVVYTLPYLGHVGKALAPFAFCITVTMDMLVTGWAYIRHY